MQAMVTGDQYQGEFSGDGPPDAASYDDASPDSADAGQPAPQQQPSARSVGIPPPVPGSMPAGSSPLVHMAPLAPMMATSSPARTSAGTGMLFVAAAAGAGAWFGGGYGFGAGLMLAAATRNVLRASRLWPNLDPVARTEAIRSGTVGLVGIGVGAWLAYEAWQRRSE